MVPSVVELAVGSGLPGLVGAVVACGVAMPSLPIWTGGCPGGGGNRKSDGGNGGRGIGMMTLPGVGHVTQGHIGRTVGVF